MRAFLKILASLSLVIVFAIPSAANSEDKYQIGLFEVAVFYATNGDPALAGENHQDLSDDLKKRVKLQNKLAFASYRLLGTDKQPIYRSYENWTEPLKPSDEILVRFEVSHPRVKNAITLDWELWLARKKILKTDTHFVLDQPLFILGPTWRKGQLIIMMKLLE